MSDPVLGMLAAAIVPPALLRTFVVGNYYVPTDSMDPTIRKNDRVLSEKLRAHSAPLVAGDIVTFPDPTQPSRTLIKRIVATQGQTVEVAQDKLYVDDVAQSEPYVQGPTRAGTALPYPYRVPDGHIFVMGDNRMHSRDSRSFGALPASSVTTRARAVYWPLEHRRRL